MVSVVRVSTAGTTMPTEHSTATGAGTMRRQASEAAPAARISDPARCRPEPSEYPIASVHTSTASAAASAPSVHRIRLMAPTLDPRTARGPHQNDGAGSSPGPTTGRLL